MHPSTLNLPGGRILILDSLVNSADLSATGPFAVLVPAFSPAERRQVEALAITLLDLGCTEFCSVGPEAERLHDALDVIIEGRGAFEIVTTWHTDYGDACEYFLFAAGGMLPTLLALVSAHPDLIAVLKKESCS